MMCTFRTLSGITRITEVCKSTQSHFQNFSIKVLCQCMSGLELNAGMVCVCCNWLFFQGITQVPKTCQHTWGQDARLQRSATKDSQDTAMQAAVLKQAMVCISADPNQSEGRQNPLRRQTMGKSHAEGGWEVSATDSQDTARLFD